MARKSFDNVQRSQTTFTYEPPASDAPRLSDSRVSASNWTGINGVPAEVITQYSVAGDGACVLTAPDGTVYKDYYGTGWQKGLMTLSEVWSGGVRQKWTTTNWTQDNTSVSYEVNPRPTETNVYDASGNRRRTTMEYHSSFGLLWFLVEYAADAVTPIRRTSFDYKNDSVYLDRRIIGLVFRHSVYDGSWNLLAKTEYGYDWDSSGDMFQDTPAPATQHDRTNYGPSFISGRGNLSQMARFDINDPNNSSNTIIETKWRVNSTGSVLMERDHLWHQKFFAYGDNFSDSVNRNTFAYPTTATDADGFSSTGQYNFDIGATTRTQGPPPAGQSQGAIQTMTYNAAGQLERLTTVNNGAYKRFWYGPDYVASYTTVNTVADEAYAIQTFDGVGRAIGAASNHPDSGGGYKAQLRIYDQMGRVFKTSNPAEINGSWVPAGDDAAGWLYMQQTYDWQGRPRITTNTDLTTREASYTGCGCAGGAVATLTDEGTIDPVDNLPKHRQQKIYSDVLGRTVKTEILNWHGGSVYAATVNSYNVRNQITQIREYAGPEGSGTFQNTTLTYDGHGRLQTRHVPEQNAGAVTTWVYNSDDTIQSTTDARGATSTFTYNNARHLPSTVTHALSGSPTIVESLAYDAAGNRTLMTDGSGSTTYEYDQLSRLRSETRTFSGLSGSYNISYEYNLADQLQKITDPTNMSINYGYNSAAKVNSVIGSGNLYANVSTYASGFLYRAWGQPKSFSDGTGRIATVTHNARLRPASFQLSGGLLSHTYSYFADGRVRQLQSSPDFNFDRSYGYDHVGRLIGAKTGGAVRGDFGEIPYYETMSYDWWDNLTGRYTESWSTDTFVDSGGYLNNRRGGWGYDADGRVTTIGTRTYAYNAAGQQTSMNGQRWVIDHYVATNMST